mmetsp:Transcript_13715/g.43923  ORF Transcript_13715/g.43923 Transcript_13715/m.43923 type:complete len:226 (-) Transcript_13715:897-1574(-)
MAARQVHGEYAKGIVDVGLVDARLIEPEERLTAVLLLEAGGPAREGPVLGDVVVVPCVAHKGVHGAERHPYRVSRERVAVGSRLCLAPRRLEVGLAQGREGEAAKVALCQRLRLARVDAPNEGGDDRGGARLPGPLHAHKGARQPEAVAARQAEGEGEEDEVERDEHECFGQAAAEADTRLGKRVELERPAARLRPQQGTLRLSAQQRQRLRRRRGELPQLRASR